MSRERKTLTIATSLIVTGLIAAGLAAASPAQADQRYYDFAKVVASKPVYERINSPRTECRSERVGYETGRERSYAGAVIGGIAGGILGNQVGAGSGKAVATAVGAATGAIVGDNIDNGGQARASRPVYEERCRSVDNWERRLIGYDVTYRYQGREYTSFLQRDPGDRLRVSVRVEPQDD